MQIPDADTVSFSMPAIPADIGSQHAAPFAYPSLFTGLSKPGQMEALPLRTADHAFWVPMILIGTFLVFAWVRLFYRRRMELIIRGVFAKNYANQFSREGNIFNERIGLALFVNYLAGISMFIYLSAPMLGLGAGIPPWLLYLAIVAFFYGFWLVKSLMVQVLSWMFSTGEHSRDLLMNMHLYNLFTGLVLLPLLPLMAYAQPLVFFYISLIIIGLIYFFRFLRLGFVGIRFEKFSVFHLILYLCTLEILPLIVLAKILSRNMIL